jgi:uncharacterized membrane protein
MNRSQKQFNECCLRRAKRAAQTLPSNRRRGPTGMLRKRRREQGIRSIKMNLYLLMKLLHVLAAFWMISGVVGRDFAFWRAGKATDVKAVHALLQISEFFERYAVIPVSMAVLLFGLIVTRMQKWPLFGFLQGSPVNWLLVSFLLFVGVMGFIAPLGLIARRKERTRAMEEALAQGTITLRLIAALNDRVVNRFRVVEMVIMVVIIVLMVTKPF